MRTDMNLVFAVHGDSYVKSLHLGSVKKHRKHLDVNNSVWGTVIYVLLYISVSKMYLYLPVDTKGGITKKSTMQRPE